MRLLAVVACGVSGWPGAAARAPAGPRSDEEQVVADAVGAREVDHRDGVPPRVANTELGPAIESSPRFGGSPEDDVVGGGSKSLMVSSPQLLSKWNRSAPPTALSCSVPSPQSWSLPPPLKRLSLPPLEEPSRRGIAVERSLPAPPRRPSLPPRAVPRGRFRVAPRVVFAAEAADAVLPPLLRHSRLDAGSPLSPSSKLLPLSVSRPPWLME